MAPGSIPIWRSTCFSTALFLSFISYGWGETCSTADCHQEVVEAKYKHSAIEDVGCLFCHTPLQEGHPSSQGKDFGLIATGGELCLSCHELPEAGSLLHPPAEEGECQTCHNPHGSDFPYLLPVGEDRSSLCQQCHEQASFSREFQHGPAASGDCNVCHNAHRSEQKGLLPNTERDLCLRCHTHFSEGMTKASQIHPPVETEPCTSCHDAHGASVRYLLQEKMPDLCLRCHDGVSQRMQKAGTKHPPLYEGETCGHCHSTHFSDQPMLLLRDQKSVCLSCHDKEDTRRSHPLANIAQQIEGKKFLHGALQNGECAACHQPHGSDHFRMLTGAYPADFYAPYEKGLYGFCLQCHEENLLRFEDTSIYTDFRNGKQNLHYLHVVDERKGRTCRGCHEPHAADLPDLISKEGAPFGDWRIPIGFEKSDTGGSCSPGCHRPLAYDRENPVNYDQ